MGAKSVMTGSPHSFVFTMTHILYTYSQIRLCNIAPYIALGNRALCLAHSYIDICQGAGMGVFFAFPHFLNPCDMICPAGEERKCVDCRFHSFAQYCKLV
jgi:hypothetical protein